VIDGHVQIHWAPVRTATGSDLASLSASELGRMSRFRQQADRDRFASGVVLSRRTLAAETGVDPRDLVINRTCQQCGAEHGKPMVPGLGVHMSVAHAGDVVGVAVSRVGPVGLDVEPSDGRAGMDLARQILGPLETAASPTEMLRYWIRKEAVVKATGDGIGIGLTAVTVSHPSAAPTLLAYPGRPGLQVQLTDLVCRGGYVACAGVITSDQVRFTEAWHLEQ
jgi:4'-phosphopantetheinyl transferase